MDETEDVSLEPTPLGPPEVLSFVKTVTVDESPAIDTLRQLLRLATSRQKSPLLPAQYIPEKLAVSYEKSAPGFLNSHSCEDSGSESLASIESDLPEYSMKSINS